MTPFRATAELAEPVVTYDDGLHFDGLLALARFERLRLQGEAEGWPPPETMDWPYDLDVPLQRWITPLTGECHARLVEDGDIWGYHASDIQWPDQTTEGSVAVRSMTDVDDIIRHTDTSKVDMATGQLKPSDKTYPTRHAPEVWWYGCGDLEAVDDLLEEITHVGKLTGHGHGRVQKWRVKAIDTDRSIAHDGTLRRRMPDSWCESDAHPTAQTIRPPYWHQSRRVEYVYPAGADING